VRLREKPPSHSMKENHTMALSQSALLDLLDALNASD